MSKTRQKPTEPFRVIQLKDGRWQVLDNQQHNRGTFAADKKADADAHCSKLLAAHPKNKRKAA